MKETQNKIKYDGTRKKNKQRKKKIKKNNSHKKNTKTFNFILNNKTITNITHFYFATIDLLFSFSFCCCCIILTPKKYPARNPRSYAS